MDWDKHTHWNFLECGCSNRNNIDPHATDLDLLRKLHEQYMVLVSDIRGLLQALDAEQTLKEGFRGMGHNILVETSSRKRFFLQRLRDMVREEE